MGADVVFEMRFCDEALSAFLTLERFLSIDAEFVVLDVGLCFKLLGTDAALIKEGVA